jgi:hypothetical protein
MNSLLITQHGKPAVIASLLYICVFGFGNTTLVKAITVISRALPLNIGNPMLFIPGPRHTGWPIRCQTKSMKNLTQNIKLTLLWRTTFAGTIREMQECYPQSRHCIMSSHKSAIQSCIAMAQEAMVESSLPITWVRDRNYSTKTSKYSRLTWIAFLLNFHLP